MFQIKGVTLYPKGTNSLCYGKMKIQVLDENWNVLSESEAKLSSHLRARIVRVRYMKLNGPVPMSKVMAWSEVFGDEKDTNKQNDDYEAT